MSTRAAAAMSTPGTTTIIRVPPSIYAYPGTAVDRQLLIVSRRQLAVYTGCFVQLGTHSYVLGWADHLMIWLQLRSP